MMYTDAELKEKIMGGALDETLIRLYGAAHLEAQKARYYDAVDEFVDFFGVTEGLSIFSAPGRTEIGGNHTDHNCGKVLAGSVDLDVIGVVARNDIGRMRVKSAGYDLDDIDLADLAVHPEEYGKSISLLRGTAAQFAEKGCRVGGFDAYTTSNVLKGSGVSSSAAFEILLGTIVNTLFFEEQVDPVELAKAAQKVENHYFGKPCGLLDQMASSVGGIVTIDFADVQNPLIRQVNFDLANAGYALCIVDTGGNHADLTDDYAAVPVEMQAVAKKMGCQVLRETSRDAVKKNIARLRAELGDRAVLRALHFFDENDRVTAQVDALERGDLPRFLSLVVESGRSSYQYLQNVYANVNPAEQGLSLSLYLAERLLSGKGAWRVHGGGFAGTTQSFVPNALLPAFRSEMEAAFGKGSCHILQIRPVGGVQII